jgi:predicted TIM-barrel fold metal-dependent hydrolase
VGNSREVEKSRTADRSAPRCIPEVLEAQVRLLASPAAPDDPSLRMAGMFSKLQYLQEQLMDIGEKRIARMDELGIDQQLLLLTAPGVQVLEPDEGTALARLANDRLAAACRRYPDRFAGLTVKERRAEKFRSATALDRFIPQLR